MAKVTITIEDDGERITSFEVTYETPRSMSNANSPAFQLTDAMSGLTGLMMRTEKESDDH